MGADSRTTGVAGDVKPGNFDKIYQVTNTIYMGACGNMTVYSSIKLRVEKALGERKVPDVYPDTLEEVSEMVRLLVNDDMEERLGHFVDEIDERDNLMDDVDKRVHTQEFEKQIRFHCMDILVASWHDVMKISLNPIHPNPKWNYEANYVRQNIVCLSTGEPHMQSFIDEDPDLFTEEPTGDQSVDAVIGAIKRAFKRDWSTGGNINIRLIGYEDIRSVALEPLTEFCDCDFKVIDDSRTKIR